jgi:hypothetical protein
MIEYRDPLQDADQEDIHGPVLIPEQLLYDRAARDQVSVAGITTDGHEARPRCRMRLAADVRNPVPVAAEVVQYLIYQRTVGIADRQEPPDPLTCYHPHCASREPLLNCR